MTPSDRKRAKASRAKRCFSSWRSRTYGRCSCLRVNVTRTSSVKFGSRRRAPPGSRRRCARVPEAQRQFLLDEFNEGSRILAGYDPSRRRADRTFHTKSMGKRLPEIATVRQRQVRTDLRNDYRKADGELAQAMFLSPKFSPRRV